MKLKNLDFVQKYRFYSLSDILKAQEIKKSENFPQIKDYLTNNHFSAIKHMICTNQIKTKLQLRLIQQVNIIFRPRKLGEEEYAVADFFRIITQVLYLALLAFVYP